MAVAVIQYTFGTSIDGQPLFVNGLGRDAWNSRRLTRLWKEAWYQDRGAQYGSWASRPDWILTPKAHTS
jgi:hypothetical protein